MASITLTGNGASGKRKSKQHEHQNLTALPECIGGLFKGQLGVGDDYLEYS